MFCSKCGKEINKESKFCNSCGSEIKEENSVSVEVYTNEEVKEPKVNSILSLIFGIILAPIGLIISIVGMVRSSSYKKKTGKTNSYLGINIAGLVLSIIGTLIFGILMIILVVFGGLYMLFSSQDELIEGTWNCSNNFASSSYITQVEFDDGDVLWGKYGDVENNNYKGSYKINNRKYTDGENEYKMIFNIKTKTIDGKTTKNVSETNIDITFNKNSATISSNNGEIYYCTKEN